MRRTRPVFSATYRSADPARVAMAIGASSLATWTVARWRAASAPDPGPPVLVLDGALVVVVVLVVLPAWDPEPPHAAVSSTSAVATAATTPARGRVTAGAP